jgi:hypothetical protein
MSTENMNSSASDITHKAALSNKGFLEQFVLESLRLRQQTQQNVAAAQKRASTMRVCTPQDSTALSRPRTDNRMA